MNHRFRIGDRVRVTGALGVRHETKVPDTDKSLRQHVQKESTNELLGGNRHLLLFVAVSVIPP